MEKKLEQSGKFNRKPYLSLLMSLFIPGLGQMYNGQILKGIVYVFLTLMIPISFGYFRIVTSFSGLIIYFIVQLVFLIIICLDALYFSNQQTNYQLKKYNKSVFYLAYLIFYLIFISFINITAILGIKTYKTPTNSCQPTIHAGDHIVVDLKVYNKQPIDYGDLVTYIGVDGQKRIYRVVGLPMDSIQIINNQVIINRKPCKIEFVYTSKIEGFPVNEYNVELPNGHIHKIYINDNFTNPLVSNIKTTYIPKDYYYLLGDNRDNALDSRYVSFIHRKQIFGKVIYTVFGNSIDRIGVNIKEK